MIWSSSGGTGSVVSMDGLRARYREVVVVDFEFWSPDGDRVRKVICVAWHCIFSGEVGSAQGEDLGPIPPYPHGSDVLIVAYAAAAEFSCYLVLGWPLPRTCFDEFVVFRACRNGRRLKTGLHPKDKGAWGMPSACVEWGVADGVDPEVKTLYQQMAANGPPWTDQQREEIRQYCETDVAAEVALFSEQIKEIDFDLALRWGRFAPVAAAVEWAGVPTDAANLDRLRRHLPDARQDLIDEFSGDFPVFEGSRLSHKKLAAEIQRRGWAKVWPVTPKTGRYALTDTILERLERRYPDLRSFRYLRKLLSQARAFGIPTGRDGRNRAGLRPFTTITSRNAPRASLFIFSASRWVRHFVKPAPGEAFLYLDYSAQEHAIAAYLSGDAALIADYAAGDPYIAMAVRIGLVPAGASKASHPRERAICKILTLGLLYDMSPQGFCGQLGCSLVWAEFLHRKLHKAYAGYFAWSDTVLDTPSRSDAVTSRPRGGGDFISIGSRARNSTRARSAISPFKRPAPR